MVDQTRGMEERGGGAVQRRKQLRRGIVATGNMETGKPQEHSRPPTRTWAARPAAGLLPSDKVCVACATLVSARATDYPSPIGPRPKTPLFAVKISVNFSSSLPRCILICTACQTFVLTVPLDSLLPSLTWRRSCIRCPDGFPACRRRVNRVGCGI